MFSANDCSVSERILTTGTFEPMSMKIWCRFARKASGIFDIGAHVGTYSLAAAKIRPDLQIQAFEPNPYAYARLRLHKTINGLWNIAENRLALSDATAITRLSWYRKDWLPISSGGTILDMRGSNEHDSVLAEMVRLDELPASKTIGDRGLIKIDVESAEMTVLRGAPGVIQNKPDILIECFSSFRAAEITKMLLPLGYRFYAVMEKEQRIADTDELKKADQKGENFNQFVSVRAKSEIDKILGDYGVV